MKGLIRKIALFCMICLALCGFLSFNTSWASEGNVDTTNKYAWSENSGWLNFRPSNGGVTVKGTYLSGYAWAENIGWIKLGSGTGPYDNDSSTNWGVNRDSGTGALSGYAWSENAGWINFNPTNSQVVINTSTGSFDGYAWAENVGWIHFQYDDPPYNVAVAAPTITSFSPTSGGTNTSVIITGTNFTGATAVKFGGTDASSFTVYSFTQITAVVAGGSTGTVTVTTPGGTATSSDSFTYGAVAAGTYYVNSDSTIGSDSNAGTAAAPWKTLHYAIDQINGGATGTSDLPYALLMAAGTYSTGNGEADTGNTLSQSHVTIVGADDHTIGANNTTTTIDGTSTTNWTKGIRITGSNVTVKGVSITKFLATGGYGIEISGDTGNEVVNCKIFNNDTGIEIRSSNAFKIRSCEIYENATDGLNVSTSTDGEISQNTIYRHQGNNGGDDGIAVFGCSPSIKRNKIYDNNTGIRVEANSTADIRNNVIYETTDYVMNYGILVKADTNSTASPTIYHNSIDGGSGDGIATEYVSESGTLTPVIKYNIITRCDVHGIDAVANTCTINYNDVWHNGPNHTGTKEENYSGCDPGANDLYEVTPGDGLGKDPENSQEGQEGPGPPASTSPCVDAIPTGADPGDPVTMDYLGYKRPKAKRPEDDPAFDMGAYEYVRTQPYTDTLPFGTIKTDYRIFTIPLDIGTGEGMQKTMEIAFERNYDPPPTPWRVFARTTSNDSDIVEMSKPAFDSLDIKPGLGLWGITNLTNTHQLLGNPGP